MLNCWAARRYTRQQARAWSLWPDSSSGAVRTWMLLIKTIGRRSSSRARAGTPRWLATSRESRSAPGTTLRTSAATSP
ncbi:unnamed protein product, partial [Ectocarpus fasciculatus]